MHLLRLHRAFCGRGRASTPGKVCRRQHNYTIGIAVRPAHSVCTAKRNTRGRCSASADVPSKECPVIPPPRFNEEYFVFPYPSADTQVGRRVDRKGDWFERTPFYPLPKHWTKAPEGTWPASLRSWQSQLRYSSWGENHQDQLKLANELERYYPDDEQVLAFTRWLRWQLKEVGSVDIISRQQLDGLAEDSDSESDWDNWDTDYFSEGG